MKQVSIDGKDITHGSLYSIVNNSASRFFKLKFKGGWWLPTVHEIRRFSKAF